MEPSQIRLMKLTLLVSSLVFLVFLLLVGAPPGARAMQTDGCGAGDCRSCHSLSKDEARGLLKTLSLNVLDVAFSEVPRSGGHSLNNSAEN